VTPLNIPKEKAQAFIRYRWGSDGRPADGSDRWRPGWRRDGATYYKLASPENPQPDDRYLGVNEVLQHDRAVYHADTALMPRTLTETEERKISLRRPLRDGDSGSPGCCTTRC